MTPMDDWEIVGAVIVIVTALLALAVERYLEQRRWNDGVCRKGGKPWKLFDVGFRGEHAYSDGDGHYIWTSGRR